MGEQHIQVWGPKNMVDIAVLILLAAQIVKPWNSQDTSSNMGSKIHVSRLVHEKIILFIQGNNFLLDNQIL